MDNPDMTLPKTFYGTETERILPVVPGYGEGIPIKDTRSNYLLWANPPSQEELERYYATEYVAANRSWYNCETDYSPRIKAPVVDAVRGVVEKFVLSSAKEADRDAAEGRAGLDSLTVLDIGCSFGGLVRALREAGFNAFGIDMNSTAIAEGIQHGNEFISCESPESFSKKMSPDVFVSHYVLEHFADPVAYMKTLHGVMGDNAVGYFSWANGNSYPAVVGRYELHGWNGYPDHLHLLGPYASFRLLLDSGFSVLRAESGRYSVSFNQENIIRCLSPLNPKAIFDMTPFQKALAANFMAADLSFVFCKRDSPMAGRHADAIEESMKLFRQFEEAGT